MQENNIKTIYRSDYAAPEYLVGHIELTFLLDAAQTKVKSRLRMQKNPESANPNAPLVLNGEALHLESVSLNGVPLKPGHYQLSDELLTLPNAPKVDVFTLEIETLISPQSNTALEGLYLSTNMLCTQCEAEGFRKITYYPDRPDVMARFSVLLIADKEKYPVLLSNGNQVSSGELKHNRHWVKWEDPFPKPCYLFALVAGQLDCLESAYVTGSGREVTLQIYAETHDIDKCEHAMRSLEHAMRWDEAVYGREYDLDRYMIVAVSHFNMGAMENKGLNVFNTKFVLARGDTATDADYEHIEAVIAHEYFHNWTGNRITCRDWFQLSLKEGLTVFRDQSFSADRGSPAVRRIEDVNLLRTRQFAEDAGPLAHPVRPDSYIEINNFYTLTVYEKGAEVVRMLHTLLGTEGFRKGSDLYFERHDGQAVTCDDFVKAMEDANQRDFTQFRHWYAQAGTPKLTLKTDYDAVAQRLTLNVEQLCAPTPGQPVEQPLHIPLKLGLISPSGQDYALRLEGEEAGTTTTRVLDVTQAQQQFRFVDIPEKPLVSALRGFSAPVTLEYELNTEQLAFLLAHDSDAFNRWDAGQRLSSRLILNLTEEHPAQSDVELLIGAFQHLLEQHWDDLELLAQLLTLPNEDYLASQVKVVDPVAIHNARNNVKKRIAVCLQTDFSRLYARHHVSGDILLDRSGIGRRKLKNTCLVYLTALDNGETSALAAEQFAQARTMTDQTAALACLLRSSAAEKNACLEQFYRQWENEALVIDKWFTLQAACPVTGTLEHAEALLQHAAFDWETPNRVRSVIGAFSQSNAVNFHREDGSGYRFLADAILRLNAINPQIAARMLTPLAQWRRYDTQRQAGIKQELERIFAHPGLARDVYELAQKSLITA
ncbi:aminopeptidase N [Candidatus Methylospira mobilis]|uniref:Aminopeptidase N n=1 Tax=Candidatus Methylospira mobilis TaxID=1808979 RepID=A0A5Q0BJ86_9GAMM|nr:aminopeptidase N [Candidatus Methylospira mobilis]QFY43192.1 aminopeptidase N [Candidatus Methylospira mobilis]